MLAALYVFIGGGLGSLARYGMGEWLGQSNGKFPIGTFAANLAACIILGFIAGMALKNSSFGENSKHFLAIGFCGGFSTFSTFTNEIFVLTDGGKIGIAALYVLLSLVICFGGLAAGYAGAKLL